MYESCFRGHYWMTPVEMIILLYCMNVQYWYAPFQQIESTGLIPRVGYTSNNRSASTFSWAIVEVIVKNAKVKIDSKTSASLWNRTLRSHIGPLGPSGPIAVTLWQHVLFGWKLSCESIETCSNSEGWWLSTIVTMGPTLRPPWWTVNSKKWISGPRTSGSYWIRNCSVEAPMAVVAIQQHSW